MCSALRSSQGVCGYREKGDHGMNEVGPLGLQLGSQRELEPRGLEGRKDRAEGLEPRVQMMRDLGGWDPRDYLQ